MKHNVINKYLAIQENIKKNKSDHHKVNIISVSKTFDIDKIMPLIEHGNIHFGENKVQEAENKWKGT